MAQPRKARAGLAFLYGIVGFSLIGLLAIALRARTGTPAGDAYEAKRAEDRRAHLAEIRKAADEKLIAAPSWANKEKGIVRIPISDAMSVTAKALAAKEVKATAVKAETIPSAIVPPYLTKAEEEAKGTEAPPAEGAGGAEKPAASEAAPVQGGARPAAVEENASAQDEKASAPVAAAEEAPEASIKETPDANPAN